MVQVDVPVAFGIGSLLADGARSQLERGRAEYFFHALLHQNLYQIFFFSWIPVYFLVNYFGWETSHMWWHAETVAAYPLFVPLVMVVFFLAANAGFLLGWTLVRHGRIWANRAVYFGVLVYSGIWIFAQWPRTFRLGTYADWLQGSAPWFYEDRTFLSALVITLILWGVPLPVYYLRLRHHGRHLD